MWRRASASGFLRARPGRSAAAAAALAAAGATITPARPAAAAASSAPAAPAVLPLASSVQQPGLPTTVLVHGLDSCKQTWEGVLSELAALGLPAVAVDLRGHGESPHAGDFRPEALASDVIAATERLGLRPPFVLVGHSMGGRVAMRLAAMDAERAAAGVRSRLRFHPPPAVP